MISAPHATGGQCVSELCGPVIEFHIGPPLRCVDEHGAFRPSIDNLLEQVGEVVGHLAIIAWFEWPVYGQRSLRSWLRRPDMLSDCMSGLIPGVSPRCCAILRL